MSAHTGPAPPGENEISAYLANRLTETEAQAFELYCLEHPDFASDVECELQMKAGLAQIQPKASAATKPGKRMQNWWPLALAASIVLAALGFLLLRPAPLTLLAFKAISGLPADLRNAPITRASLIQVRGNQSTTTVVAPADGVVELRFLADPASTEINYTLQVAPLSSTGSKPLVLNGLKAGSDGYLSVYLAARQLIGKSWSISLKPTGDSSGSSSDQLFRVQFNTPASN